MTPENFVNQGRKPFAVPSATQMRISASLCTESFHRYGSSTPTLKIPTIGLRPIVERNSLPFLPLTHGEARPRRACRSAIRVSAERPILSISSELKAPPPVLGITQLRGLIFLTSESHNCHKSNNRSCRHCTYACRASSLSAAVRGKSKPVAALKFSWQCRQ